MEYQKITSLFNDTVNQPSKYRRGNWVEINVEWKGRYDNGKLYLKNP